MIYRRYLSSSAQPAPQEIPTRVNLPTKRIYNINWGIGSSIRRRKSSAHLSPVLGKPNLGIWSKRCASALMNLYKRSELPGILKEAPSKRAGAVR